MPRIYIKEQTTIESPVVEEAGRALTECSNCSRVEKGSPNLVREADCDGGEWTQATAYIYAPDFQNMLVIPSATSLADAVDKTRRCGGDPNRVWFYSSPVLACAPYVRCNL
jgi:hypothetical protein